MDKRTKKKIETIDKLCKAVGLLIHENGGKYHDVVLNKEEMKEAIIFGNYHRAFTFLTNRLHDGLPIDNFDDIFESRFSEYKKIIVHEAHLKYDDKIKLANEIIERSNSL